jgi:hypothetical protein
MRFGAKTAPTRDIFSLAAQLLEHAEYGTLGYAEPGRQLCKGGRTQGKVPLKVVEQTIIEGFFQHVHHSSNYLNTGWSQMQSDKIQRKHTPPVIGLLRFCENFFAAKCHARRNLMAGRPA